MSNKYLIKNNLTSTTIIFSLRFRGTLLVCVPASFPTLACVALQPEWVWGWYRPFQSLGFCHDTANTFSGVLIPKDDGLPTPPCFLVVIMLQYKESTQLLHGIEHRDQHKNLFLHSRSLKKNKLWLNACLAILESEPRAFNFIVKTFGRIRLSLVEDPSPSGHHGQVDPLSPSLTAQDQF